jgi:hypothetical protein
LDRTTALALARVARQESARALREIRAPGYPRPYFVSYLVRDEERWCLSARYGSLETRARERLRNAFADVRVGSYAYDQVRDGGLLDNDKEAESYGYVGLPFGGGAHGLRHGLWRLTEARYREAVEAFLDKRSREMTYRDPGDGLRAFERQRGIVDLGWSAFPEVDQDHWAAYVEEASLPLKRFPDVKDSKVTFEADHVCRVFASSEGARLIECRAIWSVECYLWLVSEGGHAFPWTVKHIVADPAELPAPAAFHREIRRAVAVLRKLAGAPTLRSFSGPALLEPVPAGLLMHEAVGHRLEGSRLLSAGEGQTFRGSLGQRILPPFLTIREDPRMRRYAGRSLVGHYRYDDEGTPARETRLVVNGELQEFLTTRTCIARRHRSSGHARTDYHQRPVSRMGLTIVETDNGLDDGALRRVLLEEIRRQNAPFGIRILDATSGETTTEAYDFQAFLGEINLASKVWPDGREEWIRGVNFVGTPLNAVRGIVAAGRRSVVDNSFCGAESGSVPVTTISPALVVAELELQSKVETRYAPYTFPMPWERG